MDRDLSEPGRPSYLTVELHSHSYHSPDCLMLPEAMLETCRRKGIDRLAITDHNAITGAEQANQLDPERVIIGEEIMTSQGELLAWFVRQRVPPGLEPMEAIELLRLQSAVIGVPHPLDSIRSGSWKMEHLLAILPHVDTLEVHNARTWGENPGKRAQRLALDHGLLMTAGSDAHSYGELGRAAMRMPAFHDAESFRRSLSKARIIPGRSSPLIHFHSRYATLRKRLGWRPR